MRPGVAVGIALGLSAWTAAARAQLHADVDAEAGALQRVLTSRPPGGGNPGLGPSFLLAGHVAVLPLVRAGAYAHFDLAPLDGEGARDMFAAGLSVRLFSPWPRGAWRAWLAAGAGYAATRSPAFAAAPATAGGYVEIPLGIGASLRLTRAFELVGEAGTRIGFGFTGSMYNRGVTMSAGNDTFAVGLLLGAAFEL